jgi:hypothetical protein
MENDRTQETFMQGLLICGILSMVTPAAGKRDGAPAEPTWLMDYAQAKVQALRERKPIFAVFR